MISVDRSKPLLWGIFVIYFSFLSLLCCLVCFFQTCDHLLGGPDLLALIMHFVFPCVFVSFPYGVPGQVWYLILLIPGI